MRILSCIATAVLILATSLSRAGELDNYYLSAFGELPAATTEAAKAATAQTHYCGMPLHRGLKRDWSLLAANTQKTLAKYLARPVLTGEAIARSNGGHFNIHYATSGADAPPLTDINGNNIPDWVETVADVFEAVYDREITAMGYRQPPGTPYDVYLQQLAGQKIYGFTQSESLTGIQATSYIVIDNDYADSIFHPYTGTPALKITAAHEFHHAIQYGYNYYFETWYAEVTSSWMEDEVYDSVNQLYLYLYPYYRNTNLALDSSDTNNGGWYGHWNFNRYLAEIASSNTVVRSIWENLATKSPVAGADIPMLPVIDETLNKSGSSLPSAFLGFTRRFLLNDWASHQNEKGLYPALSFGAADTYTVGASFTVPAATLPSYSFKYLKLLPQSATPSTLTISYPAKPATHAMIAILQSATGTSQYPADLSGNINIPAVSSADALYLLICNNTTGATATPAEPVQSIPSPTDATNPNTGSATTVTPPPANSLTSGGGGGGGGCFIATAAYGSYLHPKVMVLREFRDRYLLTNAPGRLLVSLYYRYSPPVADMIREHGAARFAVRLMLAPVIFAFEHAVTALSALTVSLFLGGRIFARRRRAEIPATTTAAS